MGISISIVYAYIIVLNTDKNSSMIERILTMHPIYRLYWFSFQNIFIFLSITLTLLFIASFFIGKGKDSSVKTLLLLWIPSLTTFITVGFASFFSGILYDELNIPNDNLILFLMGYSTIVFFLHTATIILKFFRTKKAVKAYSN